MEAFQKSQEYLEKARAKARANGYDPSALTLATDGVHKLTYQSPMKKIHFGRQGYGDHIYYSKFQPDIAEQKKSTFQKSHGAISRLYNLGKFSANELALKILW
jgi:hypothetical protein